jgi:peptide/nickel transport system ATP-binding protein
MTALLELRGVTKTFGRGRSITVALDDMTLRVNEGVPHVISIAGESGSGKTTIGMLLLGFYTPTRGQVLYRGQDLRTLSGAEQFAFRKDVQAVFQDPFAVYNPFYKVDNLLSIPLKNFGLAKSKHEAREMMEHGLSRVGLRPEDTLGRYPHQLSGGQRQRIAVARALVLRPKLLIADEPVSMVDASLRASLLRSLREMNQELEMPILYITHDLTTAYHVSDYIVILYHGSVMEAGSVDAIIKDPKHPYTRLLVASIPWPDPDRTWGGTELVLPRGMQFDEAAPGCKYALRCPTASEACAKERPPLFRLSDGRAVACRHFETGEELPGVDIGALFASKVPTMRPAMSELGGEAT